MTWLYCKARLPTLCTWSVKNVKLHGCGRDKTTRNSYSSFTRFCVAFNGVVGLCLQSHAHSCAICSSYRLAPKCSHSTIKKNIKTRKKKILMKAAGHRCETFHGPGLPSRPEKIWLDTPPPGWERGELRLRKDGALRELRPGPQRRLEPRCSNRSLPELRRATLGRSGPGTSPPARPPPQGAHPSPPLTRGQGDALR